MLPVFVYGTLRPGSWNHDRWLEPWLVRPCRPGRLAGHAIHLLDELPYLVPDADAAADVVGDVADLDSGRGDEALAELDRLEGVDLGHLDRVEVVLVGGERAWAYVAGSLVRDSLGVDTRLYHGDWLAVR